ncbi:PD-(D/E)XK nuclease family protein [Thermoflexus hugenholtzii]
MATENLKEAVRQALPQWLREDPAIRQVLREALIEVLRPWEEVLSELRSFRQEAEKQREADRQVLTGLTQAVQQLIETSRANSDAIQMLVARSEEHSRRLEEHSEVIRRLVERVEEHSQRLEEHSEVIRQLIEKVERHAQVIERLLAAVDRHSQEIRRLGATIGAIGARWGLHSEAAFRDGMAALLQEAGWQVDRFLAMDPEGYVFGRPDQVEIDVVIRDGKAILIEIRSSVSRGDVAAFQRKAEFYARRTGLPVARRILISPMVDPRARDLAQQMGMEVYTYPEDVPPESPAGG